MNKYFLIVLILMISTTTLAKDSILNLQEFAENYFDKMVASQAPKATEKELEAYLSLLADDIGHSHLPYVTDDSRLPDGKQKMRKGMTFYLGLHTEYRAELLDIFAFNDSAVAIRYKNSAKGIHPQTKKAISYSQTMMEVLEMENGKVAVIRKYHE